MALKNVELSLVLGYTTTRSFTDATEGVTVKVGLFAEGIAALTSVEARPRQDANWALPEKLAVVGGAALCTQPLGRSERRTRLA